jgi:predicted dienelactone hydrolase
MSSFLCTHLASHGYIVAALDHFEVVAAADFVPREGETEDQKAARVQALIANRLPDVRLLLDHLFGGPLWDSRVALDPTRVGIVGYSFGGWTALAATAVEWRIRAVVALAPGGSSRPKPGILPATLTFAWGRDVPTLYLAAENDTMTPLDGMHELFERTPATKRMVVLRRADHVHFLDNAEEEHEMVRTMSWTGNLAWIPKEMRPITELCSGGESHSFARALALAHFDASLIGDEKARRFLDSELEGALRAQGLDAFARKRRR